MQVSRVPTGEKWTNWLFNFEVSRGSKTYFSKHSWLAGGGIKKKGKFQPLIKRRTVSSKIEGRGESEVTSGRGMRKDTQMRQSLAALKMG